MGNSQTKATARYQKKVGLINKGFKLRKTDTEAFAAACEAAGISQAAKVTRMMRMFDLDMDDQLYARLKAYADRMNLLVKDVIDDAVTQYLDKEENR